jgi:hypothetical protein
MEIRYLSFSGVGIGIGVAVGIAVDGNPTPDSDADPKRALQARNAQPLPQRFRERIAKNLVTTAGIPGEG